MRTPRRRTSVVGVIGEVLITAGVIVLLYVVWQLWVGDLIYGAERNAEGTELSQEWQARYEEQNPEAAPAPTTGSEADPEVVPVTSAPPVLAEPADGVEFAVMRIPRFGADYAVRMAGGVTRARTLDPIGIGHYPGTRMPGEPGNFALAAHRTTWGKPFNRIADLHVGDAIVVETQEGWYTYRFRTLEYVTPNEVEVLLPVPQAMDVPAGTAYITLTSCSPMYAMTERIVAYGVFESFTPRSVGEPASLQAVA
ncbi:class E sortase [Microbacterium sp. LWH3-1.2]|uniref:class E sortase n=1 Tax=Microbacterium sp. LWH3-1.2 TaxID=3135256 RepID=UPI00341C84E1